MPIISNFPGGSGSGGGGLALAAASDIKVLTASGKVYVKWTDPEDMVVGDVTLATWAGTVLVRKAGSKPTSRRDGAIVLDSKERNKYKDAYFCDSGLTNGVEYFYKLFPYSTSNTYTDSPDGEFSAIPNAVAMGDVSGITLAAAGNGKLSIKWTDPAATIVEDGVTLATWASTIVVVKEESYAASPNDPDAAFTYTSTTRNGHTSTPLVATGLTNGKTCYVTLFPMSTDGAANTNEANRKTGVANRIAISNIPAQSGTLTYNGNSQTPSWSSYNSAQLTLGGTTSGTNAASYDATFTPKDDYMWSDGTTTVKTVTWSIAKATGSLSLSASAVTLNNTNLSKTITVTRAGNGAISVTSSNTSVATASVSGTTITINHVNQTTGTATITVKVAAGTNHTAPANKTISVTAQFVTIYGVEWDWTSSGPTKGTRTDAAAGFSDPNPAVNNGTGSSPFDNLMPWAGMVKETRTGGVMVKEPKYWFKWTKTGKKLKLQIADGPVDGFHVDPVNMDRGDGLGELDFSYIGRYHCVADWKSETNKAPKDTVFIMYARTGIHNLGSNIWQMDFAQMWYVGMLYLVEFADWDGQSTIGKGCSPNNSAENNGMTDTMQYHTGTTATTRIGYGHTQYRNIEGWWDNVYDWMDGCYYTSSGLNVILNPNQFSNDANGVLVGLPVTGFPSDFAIPTQGGLEWALYPSAGTGSVTTYTSDSWYFDGSKAALYHGALSTKGIEYGPFCVRCEKASTTSVFIGCRLQERPPKAA